VIPRWRAFTGSEPVRDV
jgi:hypothetical protein